MMGKGKETGSIPKAKHLSIVPRRATAKRDLIPPDLFNLSGGELVRQILDLDNPREIVQRLPLQDFYWLIKKVGENDALPLLELGTRDQWQHVLDLEIWKKDRIDLQESFVWLQRLQLASAMGVAKWLFSDAQHFAYFFFFKSLQVEILKHDDPVDLPQDFFTLDGIIYIKAKNPEQRETLENILRAMAHLDFERYQNLILGLSGVLPAELEEELFRWRNVRLAEHGFLPFDEAFSVYAALPPESLAQPKTKVELNIGAEEGMRPLIPSAPLQHVQDKSLLAEISSKTDDVAFLDRIRLEFAGLCNQILSADGLHVKDFDTLVKTCKRAAGYLNVALERVSGQDLEQAEHVLKKNILLTVFRVGFGFALRAKWEAERWVKESWFHELGLHTSFWGERWGGVLQGLLQRKPLYYAPHEQEEFRDFERFSEVEHVRLVSNRLKTLDKLLREVSEKYQISKGLAQNPEVTFYPVLFTLWARHVLGEAPAYTPIPLGKARALFEKLREGEGAPPYKMKAFKEEFIRFFITEATSLDTAEASLLKETLSVIWEQFREEYEWVHTEDLDSRFSSFIRIEPSP